ncbi:MULTISPECIES: DUF6458 family protein [unclassified Streptomyces]|uniref:DUF6458 family protein n=1 Tax=Streptomycetaceae TaxID=2062 RepID=UPI002E79C588|nr:MULTISPECIES: DUF6458 family protein [unclassified Streptomyces]MED7951537.1 DUF6458 family protein [Streptomyces sp. BE303]MEE1827618.1 DUF6458 family protein [Streptomyces sp. BE20]
MGIGGCIILFAAGAILTFAVDWELSGVNVDVVGIILMVAGLLGIAVYARALRRRRALGGSRVVQEPMVEERRYFDGP